MAADVCSEEPQEPSSHAIGPGLLVLVVGPSGAGKDAILREARQRLSADQRFAFPPRIVTRRANEAEDHTAATPAEFEDLVQRRALAVHWDAHGLRYGISRDIDRLVGAGRCVAFNASRYVVPAVRSHYANVAVVLINAPLQLRAQRLAAREREPAHDIAARLTRVVQGADMPEPDLVICNDGALECASDLLIRWLRARVVPADAMSST